LETLKNEIARAIGRTLIERFGEAPERVVVEYPPQPGLGDLASPIAFEMARRLRRAPRQIAQEIAGALPPSAGVERVEAGGAGYVNLFLNRPTAAARLARELAAHTAAASGEKVIVEHTNINPNKAAHIGHLRNAVLGDTLARALRYLGHDVEVQNYIDNTGVQVADLVIGFTELLGQGIDGARMVTDRFDYFCWDLYARVTEMYRNNPDKLSLRASVLKQIEEGEGEVAGLAAYLAQRIVQCHLDTMGRIGVHYDLLPWESDILAFKFWETAFRLLRQSGAITRIDSGERSGCWVMSLEGPGFENLKEGEKIIVRSNGTVTYVGKDIAYQLWKFGLLGADFRYRPLRQEPGGRTVWTTTHDPGITPHPPFGAGGRVYNVIDVRQAYLQAIVVEGLKALGYTGQAERSVHFSYEMVALTPASAERLGVTLSEEDRGRPYLEMSGRRGLGIKADDLLDALRDQARREVLARNPQLETSEADAVANDISVGALRYFMIKYARNTVLAFDFDEALSFEGESGPYLQYALVRAGSIFDRMGAAGGPGEGEAERWGLEGSFDLPADAAGDDHWALLLQIARFRETVTRAVESLELSQIAKYAFGLAQSFNSFYHKYPVMKEPDERWRRARIILTHTFRSQMRRALDLMGLPVPRRM